MNLETDFLTTDWGLQEYDNHAITWYNDGKATMSAPLPHLWFQNIVYRVYCNGTTSLLSLFWKSETIMEKTTIPFLCGGTFFAQILRARRHRKSPAELAKGQKESLSEPELFRRLISIYHLNNDFKPEAAALRPMPAVLNNVKTILFSLLSLMIMTNAETLRKISRKRILKLFPQWYNLSGISLMNQHTNN